MFSISMTLLCALIGVQGLCREPRCLWNPPFCTYGRKKDGNGCDTCECDKKPDSVVPVDVFPVPEVDECETPVCHWTPENCQYGRKKDGEGCDTCECAGAPVDPTPFPVTETGCSPLGVTCRMLCEFGWAKDDQGCDVCECAEPKPFCNDISQCKMECLYGRTKNEDGCEVCECMQEPMYDCQSKETWSQEQTEFCCRVEGRGCPPPRKPQYTCLSKMWTKEQWSQEKKDYCCESMNIGCIVEVSKRSTYNCLSREMWSEDKKVFCCAAVGLGCHATSVKAERIDTKGDDTDLVEIAMRAVAMEALPETEEELMQYFDYIQHATQSANGSFRKVLPRARMMNRIADQATGSENWGA